LNLGNRGFGRDTLRCRHLTPAAYCELRP
jgi:hypothetical protein